MNVSLRRRAALASWAAALVWMPTALHAKPATPTPTPAVVPTLTPLPTSTPLPTATPAPAPRVSEVFVDEAARQLDVVGQSLGDATTVTLGGDPLAIESKSPTNLVATLPPLAPGSYQLVVSTPGGGSVFEVAVGAVGPAGPSGATGPAGPQGSQGATGSQGQSGPIGPTGPTGPQGPAGVQGPSGTQGPSGPQGPSGATGLRCWDLDSNDRCDLALEDADGDGACTVFDCRNTNRCASPQNDCGGVCVNVASDAGNCGSCGHACGPNESCQGGVCQSSVVSCAPGACEDANPCTQDVCLADGSCSHSAANGGACDDGNACTTGDSCQAGVCTGGTPISCPSVANAVAGTCSTTTGACSYSCFAGFGNCDGSNANGCEVNLSSDVSNCGGCGVSCGPGRFCASGICR